MVSADAPTAPLPESNGAVEEADVEVEVKEMKQSWKENIKPKNPIGFAVSVTVSLAAVLLFFFAIPCPT